LTRLSTRMDTSGGEASDGSDRTSTDWAFTHGRIGPSHTVEQTVSTEGCAAAPSKWFI
jgi:hypothetical protein